MNLHDSGRENRVLNSDDVAMIGHGYGVSQYTQYYDQH